MISCNLGLLLGPYFVTCAIILTEHRTSKRYVVSHKSDVAYETMSIFSMIFPGRRWPNHNRAIAIELVRREIHRSQELGGVSREL